VGKRRREALSQTPLLRRPAVFLDRDGTLNRQVIREGKPYPPQSLAQFELFPDVTAGCRALAQAGFALVVATNQPDVGRGDQRREEVEAMHTHLVSWVPEIERIEVCYDPGRGEPSRRRKPETGMITDAAEMLSLDLGHSWMVGDRWRDIDCGKRAGLRTVFIDFGYAEELREQPDFTVKSFAEAVSRILSVAKRST
jgi:D-glycero-D-manno-heptose 1,7-bisphosphate phosphatase